MFAVAQTAGIPSVVQETALDVVVVTAQKRKQAAADVPVSMTVLTGRDIENAHGAALEDVQQLVPNFSFEQQSGFYVLTMRGIGGGGRNIGFDPRVGVYLDGVYMGQAQALRKPLFDIEQMEVLRGPQGDMFGRNTVAGAVNMTSRAPTPERESDFRIVAGNYGIRETRATASGPLSDRLLGRLALAAETRDGFGRNQHDGRKLDDLERYSLRGQFVATPTERLKISASADASRSRQNQLDGEPETGLFGQPLPAGPLSLRTVNVDAVPYENVDLSGAALVADYALDDGRSLKAIFGYRDTRQAKQLDVDYGPRDLVRTHYLDRFTQSSQEIRLASPDGGRTHYVIGVYHLNETATTDRKAFIGQDVATDMVKFPDVPGLLPFGPTLGLAPGGLVYNRGTVRTDTWAAFGAVDQRPTDALTLHAGARYTRETKNIHFDLNGADSGALDVGTLMDFRDARSEGRLSPTVGAVYAASRNLSLYGKLARAFKSGGWNVEFLSTNGTRNPAFDSETADSFEIGAKGQAWGGSLRYDFAAYATRIRNFQVLQFVDLGAGATSIDLRNAAAVLSRGIEGDVALRVGGRLNLGARFGTTDSHFSSFNNCSPLLDCTGHQLPYAPRTTAALTASYDLPLDRSDGLLRFYGEASFHGKAFADPVNDPATQTIPRRELINLRAAYLPYGARWELAFWVRNATNRSTVITRDRDFLGNLVDKRLDPRTVGIEARFTL
jgi:iron complex outermembrane receptor protein